MRAKILIILGLVTSLAVLAGLIALQERAWDPEVAALVDGRPILKSSVNRVLEWGFYPQALSGSPRQEARTIENVLEKLINEQLILAEAAKAGLTVSDSEIALGEQALDSAWFGVSPPPAEMTELRQALRNQMLLRKMTEKVMVERRVLSPSEWAAFWEGWPKNRNYRLLVRVLMLPPLAELPEIPARRQLKLDDLADFFETEGFLVIVSDKFWLSASKLEPDILKALEEAALAGRPVGPFRLAESWAAYEVLEIDRGLSQADELREAAAAFEDLAGEKAFQKWLEEIRTGAEIKVNRAFVGPEY